jgi:crotonobetainyl-CoA:carnitine CoA-transferase CaiB-like acyl-CoA transferase
MPAQAGPTDRDNKDATDAAVDALVASAGHETAGRLLLGERLRLTYDDLKHVNPRIVCCSLSGFGMTGPRRSHPGYDYILQGLAGWMG